MADLPRGVVEAALNNYYRAGIVKGASRTSLYNSSVGTQLGIRKTDSLAISREAQVQADTILSLRDLPNSSPIQPSNMLEMKAPGQAAYMYKVEVTMVTTDGYTLDQQYMPIWYDGILTKEDVQRSAESITKTKGGTEIDVTAGSVTEAWRNTS